MARKRRRTWVQAWGRWLCCARRRRTYTHPRPRTAHTAGALRVQGARLGGPFSARAPQALLPTPVMDRFDGLVYAYAARVWLQQPTIAPAPAPQCGAGDLGCRLFDTTVNPADYLSTAPTHARNEVGAGAVLGIGGVMHRIPAPHASFTSASLASLAGRRLTGSAQCWIDAAHWRSLRNHDIENGSSQLIRPSLLHDIPGADSSVKPRAPQGTLKTLLPDSRLASALYDGNGPPFSSFPSSPELCALVFLRQHDFHPP
ncbi:hypothetical protein GGX14DRAFT_568373 [Mycena pura]|uniref:Uncharacterized protein n=1 Tax=Mycena pura TaxID=153505 RepID=A0AAD6V9B5_9AGAR|nr:hypothetical protein GGX14DRAFT_568373 [Mycena pura]